jgi:hypothetical protein
MGIVMIKCRQTGRAISTGIETDRESFRCSAVFFARTHCPICHVNHEWFAREAWLYEPAAQTLCVSPSPRFAVPGEQLNG